MSSLLIFTPTHDNLMRSEMEASIKAQVTTVSYDWEVSRHNPHPGRDMRNVIAQYQRAWQMALAGGYDALLTVEHDMILPPDAIEKLWNTDAPVVYGVYMLRHGTKTLNTWQYCGSKNMGMSLSLYPNELNEFRRWGHGEVSGTGWGCTLIRRDVLGKTVVRQSGDMDAGDISFSIQCIRAGIKQVARFDVPCGHIEPNGNILHPYENGGIVSRVLALQNVTCQSDNQTVVMKAGRYYSIVPLVARDLARAGYVLITNEEKIVTSDERETADAMPVVETAVATVSKRKPKRAK